MVVAPLRGPRTSAADDHEMRLKIDILVGLLGFSGHF
jgi:hypothetical protein